jgi:MinD superfamily P-loop ATPase
MTGVKTTKIKEITIISGKGGTGKTTLTAAFATLAHPDAVLADCDVDAADLHLILKPKILERKEFHGLNVAAIDGGKCITCGNCVQACRFDAITESIEIVREKCEGCGVCELVCPENAISLVERVDGESYTSDTRFGPLSHARLQAGGEASGKLVAEVRSTARLLAKKYGKSMILSDGPPGIGCPVISTISGTNLAVLVTEPTVSGISDLKRVLETTDHFNVPTGVVINKSDINPVRTREIHDFCGSHNIPIFGEIRYDNLATEAMVAEKSIIEYSEDTMSKNIARIWNKILFAVGSQCNDT